MLDTSQLQQLKRTNISKDPEKTKERVTALWQGLKIKQKQAIRTLADITAQPIYRTQETGTISARLVLAFAQSLNINPYYLTGEADEPGECTELLIRELLLKYGYRALVAEIELPEEKPAKRKYTRREQPTQVESSAEKATEEDVQADEAPTAAEVQLPPGSEALTAEDLQQLI
ncbi:MAG: hypothetical protein FWH55_10920, partial [Oscillospiraceae bacterium]|nr:hypothetical protein [Oscillospiraceae bacterium]